MGVQCWARFLLWANSIYPDFFFYVICGNCVVPRNPRCLGHCPGLWTMKLRTPAAIPPECLMLSRGKSSRYELTFINTRHALDTDPTTFFSTSHCIRLQNRPLCLTLIAYPHPGLIVARCNGAIQQSSAVWSRLCCVHGCPMWPFRFGAMISTVSHTLLILKHQSGSWKDVSGAGVKGGVVSMCKKQFKYQCATLREHLKNVLCAIYFIECLHWAQSSSNCVSPPTVSQVDALILWASHPRSLLFFAGNRLSAWLMEVSGEDFQKPSVTSCQSASHQSHTPVSSHHTEEAVLSPIQT